MIQVEVSCPMCKAPGRGEIPDMHLINTPLFSQVMLVHEKFYTCPNCLGVSGYSIANLQMLIGLIPAPDAQGQILVPNGMPKLPKLEN